MFRDPGYKFALEKDLNTTTQSNTTILTIRHVSVSLESAKQLQTECHLQTWRSFVSQVYELSSRNLSA